MTDWVSAVGGGFGRLDMWDLGVMETATECTVITLVSIRCWHPMLKCQVTGDMQTVMPYSSAVEAQNGSTMTCLC